MLSSGATIEQQSLIMHGEKTQSVVQLLLRTNASMPMHTALLICSWMATMHMAHFLKLSLIACDIHLCIAVQDHLS